MSLKNRRLSLSVVAGTGYSEDCPWKSEGLCGGLLRTSVGTWPYLPFVQEVCAGVPSLGDGARPTLVNRGRSVADVWAGPGGRPARCLQADALDPCPNPALGLLRDSEFSTK